MLQRPSRSVLTILGTVLGIGAFVAILGLTVTADGQVDKRFTVLAATEVTVQDVGSGNPDDIALSFPDDASARIGRLNGVRHAGVYWAVPLRNPTLGSSPDATNDQGGGLSLMAASPEALVAMHATMKVGRKYDEFAASRKEHVAVLGIGAAAQLGITRLDANPAVFINGRPYSVFGVIGDVQRDPEMLLSVIIPTSTALQDYGPPSDQRAQMLIETRVGAANLIASQAPLALRPDQPTRFKVVAPADPHTLRDSVASDLNTLFVLLAAISLVVGAVGIANTTLVSVLERTNEIGLRRSMGALRWHVGGQFLIESATLGLFGGLIGSSLGVTVVITTAVMKQWTAILAPWTVLLAPVVGTGVGLLAGVYPALRAASIEPVEALRR